MFTLQSALKRCNLLSHTHWEPFWTNPFGQGQKIIFTIVRAIPKSLQAPLSGSKVTVISFSANIVYAISVHPFLVGCTRWAAETRVPLSREILTAEGKMGLPLIPTTTTCNGKIFPLIITISVVLHILLPLLQLHTWIGSDETFDISSFRLLILTCTFDMLAIVSSILSPYKCVPLTESIHISRYPP